MFGFRKKKKQPEQTSAVLPEYILEIADSISGGNAELHGALVYCLDEMQAYRIQYAARFAERGIDASTCDADTLCWIAMTDELEAVGDCIGIDTSLALEDFLWCVSQLNAGKDLDLSVLKLDENDDVTQWLADCNTYLKSKNLMFCGIDIDSDDIELILVTAEVYDKISALAKRFGHRVVPADTL